ncbi:MAG: cation-translocating P-type ATPase [Candidatus Hodarchaeales archaeon]|jgi:Ca2+-transporting ATPase
MTEKWHTLSSDKILKILNTSESGLSEEEAAKRLEKYGYNEIEREGGISPLFLFFDQFKDFLIIILIVAAVISIVIGFFESFQGGTSDPSEYLLDAIVIMVIVILNALLGFYQEYRAEKAIEALQEMQETKSVVTRDGNDMLIPSSMLVPGDIVDLEAGNSVPADIRLIQSFNVKAVEAALTGESVPVSKQDAIVSEDSIIGDQIGMTFMGTNIVTGRGMGVVVRTGMRTEIGEIARMISEVEQEDTPLQKKLAKLGKQLGIIILVICGVVSIAGVIRFGFETHVLIEMFILGVSLAVAAIPEGLPAVVTLSLAIGVRRMIKRNALIRKLPAVETLGSSSVICSDKTGTITHNTMTVRMIWTPDKEISVTGRGWSLDGVFLDSNNRKIDPTAEPSVNLLLEDAVCCNNASVSKNGNKFDIIGDPTEAALVVLGKKAGISKSGCLEKYPSKFQFPFDSERKLMSTVHGFNGDPSRRVILVKGAVDVLLKICDRYIDVNGEIKPLNDELAEKIIKQNDKYAENALRVLSFAYKEESEEIDSIIDMTQTSDIAESKLIFLGLVGMIDPPRKETKEAIEICQKAGIKVKMITGDHAITAVSVAKEIGLINPKSNTEISEVVLTGKDMDKLTDDELASKINDIQVFARVSPAHKLKIISALKKHKEVVVMTGDGVNDAPALAKADIGVAMGITGTDVSKEASEMILTDDNFATIVNAVEEGRSIFDNMLKFITYLLSCNAAEVLTIFVGIMIGLPLPLLAIQILWVNLMTDALPALALGVSATEPDVMTRPPRPLDQGILNKDTASNILVAGLTMSLFTLLVFIAGLGPNMYNPSEEILRRAQTAALTVLITFQLFHAINNSEKGTIFTRQLFLNKYLFLAIIISFSLHLGLIYIPFMQEIFRTTGLNIIDLMIAIGVSFIIVPIDEVRKIVVKRFLIPAEEKEVPSIYN